MDFVELIKSAKKVIAEADSILFTAGAGMGVDSGLPDFRGNTGFWKAYPPIAKLGISFVDMANPKWFESKPQLAWAFYGHRLNLYRKTDPHDGFSLALQVAEKKNQNYFVFTSNVDGQFQKAGFSNDKIEECHGSIHHLQCVKPCCSAIWDASSIEVVIDEDKFEAQYPLPECPNCGGLARPNVLMFGDWSWISSRTENQSENLQDWLLLNIQKGNKLVIIEAGAGLAVPTVRYTSETVAQRNGGTLIRINPRDYQVPHGHISIPLGAKEGLYKFLEDI